MLGIIVATLFISIVLNMILKKLSLPTIIGYIITGTTIAYTFGLQDAVNNEELKEIAEFGIAFLMFTIGLEFSIKHLKEMKYDVFVVGSMQILLTASIVLFFAYYLFGLDIYSAFVIAMATAMSSTAIVLKTFNETGEINKKYGRNALGILIMQDIAVIPILVLIGIIGSQGATLSNVLIEIVGGVVILIIAMYIISKYLLEPFYAQVIKSHSDELFVGSILFLAIGASYGAHLLGFSYSLGAFVAGMLISETKYKHQAEADLIPFRDLLLGIFFITVGMQIDFNVIFEYSYIILGILFAIMLIKFTIIYVIIRLNKSNNKRTTFKTALSLLQIGEFALAVLELARVNSIIQDPYAQVMIITIVLSMIITPFILKNLTEISDFLIDATSDSTQEELPECSLSNHIVLLGYGEFGRSIARKLKEDEDFYIVVENNIDQYHIAKENKEEVILGNAANRTILQKANTNLAKKVIIAIDNPQKLYNVCHEIQKMVDSQKIIVKVHSVKEKEYINSLGIERIVVENEETSRAILEYI